MFERATPMTLIDLYNQSIKPLSRSERLRLASLILNDLTATATVDEGTEWRDEDYRDFTNGSWSRLRVTSTARPPAAGRR